MFYKSQSSTSSQDPVLLWLNGGPGCSSLQGAFNENGPFVFEENSAKFIENPHAWTNFVNYQIN